MTIDNYEQNCEKILKSVNKWGEVINKAINFKELDTKKYKPSLPAHIADIIIQGQNIVEKVQLYFGAYAPDIPKEKVEKNVDFNLLELLNTKYKQYKVFVRENPGHALSGGWILPFNMFMRDKEFLNKGVRVFLKNSDNSGGFRYGKGVATSSPSKTIEAVVQPTLYNHEHNTSTPLGVESSISWTFNFETNNKVGLKSYQINLDSNFDKKVKEALRKLIP